MLLLRIVRSWNEKKNRKNFLPCLGGAYRTTRKYLSMGFVCFDFIIFRIPLPPSRFLFHFSLTAACSLIQTRHGKEKSKFHETRNSGDNWQRLLEWSIVHWKQVSLHGNGSVVRQCRGSNSIRLLQGIKMRDLCDWWRLIDHIHWALNSSIASRWTNIDMLLCAGASWVRTKGDDSFRRTMRSGSGINAKKGQQMSSCEMRNTSQQRPPMC